ncbi:hydroxypyruvate isomerase, partial [Ectopseudomonas khazarica]
LAFPPLLSALRDSGYDGWLGAEYKPGEAGTQASLGWLPAFRA